VAAVPTGLSPTPLIIIIIIITNIPKKDNKCGKKGGTTLTSLKTLKYENTDSSSAEGSEVSPNFNAPDGGLIRRNIQCCDEFEKDLILNLDIVAWWTVKTENIF
jgi:hypothetical protein